MARLIDTPQWTSGQSVERWLDDYFTGFGWIIERTSQHQERVLCLGDRQFNTGSETFYVEYKSGIQTFYTGNIFLETVSVDTENKPGWVYTCKANYIMYAALLNKQILVFLPDALRAAIEDLKRKFREVPTSKGQNATYKTWGVIVPMAYARDELAYHVYELD